MKSKLKDYKWPKTGRDNRLIKDDIIELPEPYNSAKERLPICYPGTALSKGVLGRAYNLLPKHINAIGSHTHLEVEDDGKYKFREGESGFEDVQRMEAEAIWIVASLIGGKDKTVDGYFCGGGTEANIEGMWIGREYLNKWPDPDKKGTVVFTTPLTHYSVTKAAALLDLGEPQWIQCPICGRPHIFVSHYSGAGVNCVGMNKRGEMSVKELEAAFQRKYEEGFRRFMIIPTVGNYLMGSIDPVENIAKFVRRMTRETNARFYIHVDASFGGFTVPFINPNLKFGFNIPEVMSVAVDADKMGRLPYPSGIFLGRKGLMSLVARKVNYIRGEQDDTVSGSRTALAPILAWYMYQTIGRDEQEIYVRNCLDVRDYLLERVADALPWVRRLPVSPYVNFAPLIIDIENGEIPKKLREEDEDDKKKRIDIEKKAEKDGKASAESVEIEEGKPKVEPILEEYHLRDDFFPSKPNDVLSCPWVVYKICIMPHHQRRHIDNFVSDLEAADKSWQRYKETVKQSE